MRVFLKAYIIHNLYKHRIKNKKILYQWMTLNIRIDSRHLNVYTRTGVIDSDKERLMHKVVVPQKFNFASDILNQWALKEKNGIRTASIPAFWYVCEDGKEIKLSFQELERQSKRVTTILENKCGFKRGENVIVMLPKISEYWLINIAAIRIVCVLSPATIMLTSKDLAYRFSSLKPSFIIAHESVADVVDEADGMCPTVKGKIIVSSSPNRRKGWLDLNHLQPESENHKCVESDQDETMMIYFTSGTTGNPKMVEHAPASQGTALDTFGRYCLDITCYNAVWCISDTGWAKTQLSGIFGSWYHGACIFVHQMTRFSPKTTIEMLSKYPIDTFCAPPLVCRTLLQENLVVSRINNVEHYSSVGETLTAEFIKQWIELTGMKIYECYGQSEAIEFVKELPKSVNGKIKRSELKQREWKNLKNKIFKNETEFKTNLKREREVSIQSLYRYF